MIPTLRRLALTALRGRLLPLAVAACAAAVGPGVPVSIAQPAAPPAAPPAASREAVPADLDAIVGNADLVVFGESSHWDFGVHGFANRLFRHLVEKKGFRVFVLEVAWGVDEVTRAMIADNRMEAGPTESFFLNAFGSPETIETIRWVRDWNAAHPTDPVRIAGYHPEQPVRDFRALWQHAALSAAFDGAALKAATEPCKAGHEQFRTELDFLAPMMKTRRAGQPAFPRADRLACLEGLGAVERFLAANRDALVARSSAVAHREAELHLLSLRAFYQYLTPAADAATDKSLTPDQLARLGQVVYEEGDRVRFEIFEALRETRYAGTKMLLWMHNWHAAARSPEIAAGEGVGIAKGTTSIGARLEAKYGPRLVTIGSVVPCARCTRTAADSPDLRPGVVDLAGRFRAVIGEGSAVVNLRAPLPGAWQALPVSVAGVLVDPLNDALLLDVVLDRQFDAVYYRSASDTILDRRAAAQKK